MSPDQPDPRELARMLISRHGAADQASDSSAADVRAAFETACREIARWVGPLGADALFSRAIAAARASHPSLAGVELDRSSCALGGVEDMVRIHGESVASDGIAALLSAMIELLSRLVGADLTERLIMSSPANSEPA